MEALRSGACLQGQVLVPDLLLASHCRIESAYLGVGSYTISFFGLQLLHWKSCQSLVSCCSMGRFWGAMPCAWASSSWLTGPGSTCPNPPPVISQPHAR